MTVTSTEIESILSGHIEKKFNVKVLGEARWKCSRPDDPYYPEVGPLALEFRLYPFIHNDQPYKQTTTVDDRNIQPVL